MTTITIIIIITTSNKSCFCSHYLKINIHADMIPAVLPLVVEKLTHEREIVRKKAVLALYRFYTRSPSSISHLGDSIRRALCDADPGVMCGSLNLFHDMAQAEPAAYKDLVSSFVSILKQVWCCVCVCVCVCVGFMRA